MDTKEPSLSVFLFPWLAHGHITPFLELAMKLVDRNFFIYFCTTPIILTSIKKKFTDHQKDSLSSIQLVEHHLPSFPKLPPHYHTTNGLPPHLMPTLLKAFELSKPTLSNTLKTLNPDMIIYDISQNWIESVASSLNIPGVKFHTSSAAVCSFYSHMFINPGMEYPFPAMYLTESEMVEVRRIVQSAPRDTDNNVERESPKISSDIVLIKSFEEIDGKYIDHWSTSTNKRIIPLGPIFEDFVNDGEYTDMEITGWLNKKGLSSTVFVSFGSEYFLKKEDMEEIAHGLELSNVNFIWVIRFPAGERIEVEEALPNGFQERVKERGMVVDGWASQTRILKHSSIGGFVSHCGWNSVLESMRFGVPIVAIPMHLDQPFNARLVVEIGVGTEVFRDGEARLHREEVAKVIREVVVEEIGERVRRKAREFSENMREKGKKDIDLAVEELLVYYKSVTRDKSN